MANKDSVFEKSKKLGTKEERRALKCQEFKLKIKLGKYKLGKNGFKKKV